MFESEKESGKNHHERLGARVVVFDGPYNPKILVPQPKFSISKFLFHPVNLIYPRRYWVQHDLNKKVVIHNNLSKHRCFCCV